MALSVGTLEHEEVVPGHDKSAIHLLGETTNSARRLFDLLRLPSLRLGWTVLARRTANGVLPSHAMLRKQSLTSQTRLARRCRFQSKHLVARSAPDDGVGRELARKPSCTSGLGMLQPALVAGRYRLVRDPRPRNGRSRQERQALTVVPG